MKIHFNIESLDPDFFFFRLITETIALTVAMMILAFVFFGSKP
jgi:hypothetical protein